MINIRNLQLVATLGWIFILRSQPYPQPSGVYVGTAPFTEEIITQKLKNSGLSKPYDKAYWENMQLQVNNHNKWVDNKVLKFKTDRSDMASIRQQMIGIQDINGLQQQLEDKRKSVQLIPGELQKSLEDVGYRGTFICVIPRGSIFQTDVDELISKAQSKIASVAVPQLNGAFIKSVTTVENGLLQEKTIKQWVKGKMVVTGSPFFSQTSHKQDYYIFGVSVEVSPLKTELQNTNNNADDNSKVVVLDMSLPEADIKSKLMEAGLQADEAAAIYKAYTESGFQAIADSYNRGKNLMVQKLNREAKVNEKKLNAEIASLEEQIKSNEQSVNDLLSAADLKISGGSSKEKLEKLNVHISEKIRSLEDSVVHYLSRRYEQWDNPVILTNSYTQQMAQTALSGLTLLQARSAITGYAQYVEVQNGLVTEYTEGKEVEFNRELQELWLVPIGGQGNTYFMGMVARYKLKGTSGGSVLGATGTEKIEEVKIGSQTWMAKNLDVSTFRNGDLIPEAKTAEEWKSAGENKQPAWCYYHNDAENGKIYGKLYNWYAVNDPRGLAPEGWHIPTETEWAELSDTLGGDRLAGTKMKSKSGWFNDGNGINSSGFNGLSGGVRFSAGSFGGIHASGMSVYGCWWSSSENGANSANIRGLNFQHGRLDRSSSGKGDGLLVRCIKGQEVDDEKITITAKPIPIEEVKIGPQTWMAKNLDVSTFRNGDVIPEAKTPEEWKAYAAANKPAWCYGMFDEKWEYNGKLYNWYAVKDKRGLAPINWHIPSDVEWSNLSDYLGGAEVAAKKMKKTTRWYKPGTNSSGFSAIPAGYCTSEGEFPGQGWFGYWWSSSIESSGKIWIRFIGAPAELMEECVDYYDWGFSIRCVKD